MHIFPSANNSVRFNLQGTRLVCKESNKLPVVYNVPIGSGAVNGKVEFSAPGYGIPGYGRHALCFAGQEGELVVAASADHGLYVWSLPNDQVVHTVVDQPLVVLRGHKDRINSVRYNNRSDTLASAGGEKVIKLWEPIAQQQ